MDTNNNFAKYKHAPEDVQIPCIGLVASMLSLLVAVGMAFFYVSSGGRGGAINISIVSCVILIFVAFSFLTFFHSWPLLVARMRWSENAISVKDLVVWKKLIQRHTQKGASFPPLPRQDLENCTNREFSQWCRALSLLSANNERNQKSRISAEIVEMVNRSAVEPHSGVLTGLKSHLDATESQVSNQHD